ncbi:MAG: universal stress protein [Rubrobacteraceae bacterium]
MDKLPTRILLAADDSQDSRLAMEMAAGMAKKLGAELHVVYVALISPWVLTGRLSDIEYQKIRQEQQGFLDSLVDQIRAMNGEVTESYFRVGQRADDEIIRLSEELNVDLIVVGSKGKGTLKRALMGSDSENVVRYSRYPVLVVRDR